MDTAPSHLPDWAREYYARESGRYHDGDDPLELLHRHRAFDKLTGDPALTKFWQRVTKELKPIRFHSKARSAHGYHDRLITTLILGSDSADTGPMLPNTPAKPRRWPRLDSTAKTVARKLVLDLWRLRYFAPPSCRSSASESVVASKWLCRIYGVETPGLVFEDEASRCGIKWRDGSCKPGQIERIRFFQRQIEVIHARLGALQDADSRNLPVALVRNIGDVLLAARVASRLAVASRDAAPTMRSNKTSWADWLRFVYDELSTDSPTYDFIRACDYAELVSVLFGVDVSDAAISKVLRGE